MNRSSFTVPAVTAAVAALLITGCSSGSSPSSGGGPQTSGVKTSFAAGSAMARIQQHGKLIVGTAFDIPFFGVKNPTSGNIEGFDADIARLLAAKITGNSDNVQFIETSAANREPFASSGKVDLVIETYSITPARQKVIDFAGPYYIAGQDMLVKKSDTSITKVDDLGGKSVCAVSGTVTKDNVLARAPQAKITEFADGKQCVEAVKDGRFDTYVDDDVTLIGEVQLAPDQLKMVGAPFTKEPYGIGIKKGESDFDAFINDTLTKAIADGTWQKIYDANIGSVVKTKPQIPQPGVIPTS